MSRVRKLSLVLFALVILDIILYVGLLGDFSFDWTSLFDPDIDWTSLFYSNEGGDDSDYLNKSCTVALNDPSTSYFHSITERQYLKLSRNCDKFLCDMGYLSHDIAIEELNFPIAFSILAYENTEQTERLLRLIYRPQNSYCIHIDAKAPRKMHTAMGAVVSCFGKDTVFLAMPAVSVSYGGFSVVETELMCMKELMRRNRSWKYFVNLIGRDFPLRTNLELVKILTAFNGSNDVDGSTDNRPRDWTEYSWKGPYDRTDKRKLPAPHGFILAKGSTHMVVSRAFVEFVLSDPRVRDLSRWMEDIRIPDEHFFQTLNHNPQFKIPGSYTGNPREKRSHARYKQWSLEGGVCTGKWIRYVCNFGAGDLKRLTSAKELFANKIRLEDERGTFHELEIWYLRRTSREGNGSRASPFDVSYYANQSFVRNHV